jgi:hypothetical protein
MNLIFTIIYFGLESLLRKEDSELMQKSEATATKEAALLHQLLNNLDN